MLESLHPTIKAEYDKHRVLSFSGDEGTGIPYDGVVELVSSLFCGMLIKILLRARQHDPDHATSCLQVL